MNQSLVHETDHVLRSLKRVDWGFSEASGSGLEFDVRSTHWYPATFVSGLPRAVVDMTTHEGAFVYDPFGGLGTTLFQALAAGRRACMTELNQVASHIVRSYIGVLRSAKAVDHQGLIRRLDGFTNSPRGNEVGLEALGSQVEALRPWFHAGTFQEIGFIAKTIASEEDKTARAIMLSALSAVLIGVSGQDRGWGYVADNVRPTQEQVAKPKEAIRRFSSYLVRTLEALEQFKIRLPTSSARFLKETNPDKIVETADSRHARPTPEPVDLLLTSPPYPDMADYSTSQRLGYYLLGMQPDEDLKTEIGARRRRTRDDALDVYRRAMVEALARAGANVRPDGYACVVMPRFAQRLDKQKIVEETMAEFAQSGFRPIATLDRQLPERRRHHNEGWATLKVETMYLYRRT